MSKSMKRPSGHKPAGGAFSKRVVQKPVRTGGPNRAQSPCAAARQGMALAPATKVEKLDAGKALPSKLGNELVNNVGTGGPGKGRTLYGQSGMQKQHGPSVNNVNKNGGEIFPGFGGKGD